MKLLKCKVDGVPHQKSSYNFILQKATYLTEHNFKWVTPFAQEGSFSEIYAFPKEAET